MSRLFAWVVVALVCAAFWVAGSDWSPPSALTGAVRSPLLGSMPPLPEGCKKVGDC